MNIIPYFLGCSAIAPAHTITCRRERTRTTLWPAGTPRASTAPGRSARRRCRGSAAPSTKGFSMRPARGSTSRHRATDLPARRAKANAKKALEDEAKAKKEAEEEAQLALF